MPYSCTHMATVHGRQRDRSCKQHIVRTCASFVGERVMSQITALTVSACCTWFTPTLTRVDGTRLVAEAAKCMAVAWQRFSRVRDDQ